MGGSSLSPIACVITQEENYFPKNPSRIMCNDRWYGLGVNFMSDIA
jgi:hypothetical protein